MAGEVSVFKVRLAEGSGGEEDDVWGIGPRGEGAQAFLASGAEGPLVIVGKKAWKSEGELKLLFDDHVRTARSKGLSERVVVTRHVLRLALLPVVTLSGLALGGLLGGSVAVERAFGVPGLGLALVQALNERDWMVIQNLVFLYGVLYTVINLIVDVSYAWLDPRIRYG